MDVDDIARCHGVTGWRCFGDDLRFLRFLDLLEGRFTQAAEGELRLFRVAVIEHGCHEVAGVALVALDQHGPEVRLARDDVDVIWAEFTVADAAPLHAIEDDAFDLNFRIHRYPLVFPHGGEGDVGQPVSASCGGDS